MKIETTPVIRGMALSAIGFACWSCGDAASKWLSMHYEVMQISFVFAVVATTLFSIISPRLGGFVETFKTQKKTFHLARGLLNTAFILLAYYSFANLPLTTVYTIVFCSPFVVAIASIPVFGEKIALHRWAAIAIGFAGVLIALRPGSAPLEPATLTAVLLVFTVSALNIIARVMGPQETPLSLVFYPYLFTSLALAPFALPVFEMPENALDIGVFIAGGLANGLGLLLVSLGFRDAPAPVAAPFQYTQIIWGSLLGLLLFGDMPGLWTLVGAGVIIASGLYLIYSEGKAHEA